MPGARKCVPNGDGLKPPPCPADPLGMATVYPRSPRSALLDWAQDHADSWSQDPQAIGLSPQRTAEYLQLIAQAKQARAEQLQLQSAAMAATARCESLAAELEFVTARMVQSVRAFAAVAPDSNAVLCAAHIQPTRPDRGPAELTPAQPGMVSAKLNCAGGLDLSWKCTQPRGTDNAVYTLFRRLAGEHDFTNIAVIGRKRFTDSTVPAGTTHVDYYVQSRRGDAVGPEGAIATIMLGNPGLTASSTHHSSALPALPGRAA